MGLFPGLRARGALHPGLTSFAPPGHFGGVADGAEGMSFQNIFVAGAEGVPLQNIFVDGAEGVPFQNIFVAGAEGVPLQNIFVDGAEGVPFQNIFVDGAEGVRLKTTGVQRNSLTAECLMNADGAGAGFNSYCGSAAGDFA
jgi:hypothetical protein